MDKFPQIVTDHLCLRSFKKSDATVVSDYLQDDSVKDTMRQLPEPYDQAVAENWIGEHEDFLKTDKELILAITDSETDELIGSIGLILDLPQFKAELGYWIGRKHQGKGMATEAAAAVVSFCFNNYDLKRIFAYCYDRNKASAKVLLNNGFKFEGCMRCGYYHNGRFEDVEIYSILREETI